MKNENKVTIKNKKIMIHKFSRYLLTLVALLTMTTGAWADEGELLVTITPDASGNIVYSVPDIATLDLGGAEYNSSKGCWRKFGGDANLTVTVADGINVTKVKFTTNKNDSWEDTDAPYQVKLSGGYAYNASGGRIGTGDGIKKIEVYGTKAAGPVVEISDDQTSAEFDMPSYDATLEYDIVRNLASNTTLNLFIGTDPVTADARLRIAKNEQTGKYAPVSPLSCALVDKTENKTLNPQQIIAAGITPTFYLLGENEEWTLVTAIDQQTMLPANIAPDQTYRMVLKAADESPLYGGETEPSFAITLFEGYPVEIAAGEFATFYSEEPLYAENEGVELYTISSVSGDKAVLSEAFDAAPANTPLLVFNGSENTQTILLIPTAEPDLALSIYEGFVGTLAATTIVASDASTDRYAFNGKEFVWVKDDLAANANKCWLEIPVANSTKARAITIVFGETTGVEELKSSRTEELNEGWYDLNGRKLSKKPTTKGIYIKNGKKVVIK